MTCDGRRRRFVHVVQIGIYPVGAGFLEGAQDIGDDLWVLWMDFDSRTAAIGTPSGAFGFIIDKSLTGGADRITAAREIMDWFGYDLARLADVAR